MLKYTIIKSTYERSTAQKHDEYQLNIKILYFISLNQLFTMDMWKNGFPPFIWDRFGFIS